MASIILQGVGDESERFGEGIPAGVGMDGDSAELFAMSGGVDDVASAGGDDLVHVETLGGDGLGHEDMRLVEDILVADGGECGDDSNIGGVKNRVEHCQGSFLMRWELAYPDKPWDGGFREPMGIDVAAVRSESDEFAGMLQSQMPRA